jgi:hypothetical protein
MTFQARSMNYYVRQFRAFDRSALERDFAVDEHWEITTMAAIGRACDEQDDGSKRERRPVDDLIWTPSSP